MIDQISIPAVTWRNRLRHDTAPPPDAIVICRTRDPLNFAARIRAVARSYATAALDGLSHAARYVSALTCAGVLIGLVVALVAGAYAAGRMGL